jgi:tRNA(fMet)-specific endonuclease VapC
MGPRQVIYLLDTDSFVFMVRGLKVHAQPNRRDREQNNAARRVFEQARRKKRSGHDLALSAITVAELEFGARKSGNYERERDATRRVLTPFSLLPFDADDCAAHYGRIRHALEAGGRGIGSLDTLIAAHALALEATLVTNNTAEFSRVPGLKCENWSAR